MAPNNPLGISRQNILSLALRSLDLALAPIRIRNRTTGVFVGVVHLHQFPRLKIISRGRSTEHKKSRLLRLDRVLAAIQKSYRGMAREASAHAVNKQIKGQGIKRGTKLHRLLSLVLVQIRICGYATYRGRNDNKWKDDGVK